MNRKKWICIFLVIAIFFSACSNVYSNPDKVNNKLLEMLRTFQNADGGFTDAFPNLNSLYSTYHGLRVIEILGESSETRQEITAWFNSREIDDVINPKSDDNLRNIRFYLLIGEILNEKIDKNFLDEIVIYAKNMQDERGFFYLSENHKKSCENMEEDDLMVDPLVLVASCYAADIFDLLDEKVMYPEPLREYALKISTLFPNYLFDDIPIISAFVKINSQFELGIVSYDFEKIENLILTSLPIIEKNYDLNNFFEILSIVEYEKLSLNPELFKNFLRKVKGVDLEISYIPDICYYLKEYNLMSLLDSKDIRLYREKIEYALDWDGSMNFFKRDSTLYATYYADKTLQLIDKDYERRNLKEYLIKKYNSYDMLRLDEKLYLLMLGEKYLSLENEDIDKKLEELLDEIKKIQPVNMEYLYCIIELFNKCDKEYNFDSLKSKQLELLNGENDIITRYYQYSILGVYDETEKNVLSWEEYENLTIKYNNIVFVNKIILELYEVGLVDCSESVLQKIEKSTSDKIDDILHRKGERDSWYNLYNLVWSWYAITNKMV